MQQTVKTINNQRPIDKKHKGRLIVWGLSSLLFLLLGTSLFLSACGGGDSSTSSSAAEDTPTLQSVFIDVMRDLMPDLSTASVTSFSDWYCTEEPCYGVLNKLLDPENGWESVYGPVEEVERMLEIIQAHEEILDTPGTYELSEETEMGTIDFTAVVTTLSGDFTVPYFGSTQSGLTTQVVIKSDDESINIMLAMDMEGTEKAMVCYSKLNFDNPEYLVFQANYNEDTTDLSVKAAATTDEAEPFQILFYWEGNDNDNTFKLTQVTNAAGYWRVMGGGSRDGDMAFRANNGDDAGQDYFVITTLAEMMDDGPDGYPLEYSSAAMAGIDNSVKTYINTDDPESECMGWLETDGFPSVDDLDDWDY